MYSISRYPPTSQKSLQAWNAADEHVLKYLNDESISINNPLIVNDRFGYLSVHLFQQKPTTVIHYASQRKAIEKNLNGNKLDSNDINFQEALEGEEKQYKLIILKIPKSLELLNMQLAEMASYCDKDSIVLCAFMTKYFSRNIISTAEKYFDSVEQSLAWKKSRVLLLKKAKSIKFEAKDFIRNIEFNDTIYKQYPGVFSSAHIDYATQFLLEHLKVEDSEKRILDLACGNGVIASEILKKNEDAVMHLTDDFSLAIASARLNLSKKAKIHLTDNLSLFEKNSFDLVVTNPPFHFGQENNIDISLSLFSEVKDVLKAGGRFIVVSSKHLNFGKHLARLFKLEQRIENKKFELLIAEKPLHI